MNIFLHVYVTVMAALLFAPGYARAVGNLPEGSHPDWEQHANPPPTGLSAADWAAIRQAHLEKRHAFTAQDDGTHHARSPANAWLARFDHRGFSVNPDAGGWEWGLELQAYGYPGQEISTQVPTLGAVIEGKLVRTVDKNLKEWFVNDSRGLEQGWTIAARPKGNYAGQPMRLHLAVRGALSPQIGTDGASVAFCTPTGAQILQYAGLKAWDADGTPMPTRFEWLENRKLLAVVVEDAKARYPLTVDPLVQLAYIKASNAGYGDNFGSSVSISGDTLVVGASWEDSAATGINGNQFDNSATDSGAVYVFVRNGATWSQQAYLKASNTGPSDSFGAAVAISGDTLVVGAIGEDSAATGINGSQVDNWNMDSGAVYVFVRSGTTWSQQAYIKASNAESIDTFGSSLSISGNTLVVGATGEDSAATGINGSQSSNAASGSGAAYVFVRSGTTWSQQAYLKASNAGSSDTFGSSLSISGDTLVVGASRESSAANVINGNQADNSALYAGAAYVFIRNGATWSQQAYLKASNAESGDAFGSSLSISGNTLVVGAIGEDSATPGINGNQSDNSTFSSGAAYVFVRNETTWSQQAYLKASNTGSSDYFGSSLSISGDTLVVGAPFEDSAATGLNGNQSDNSKFSSGAAYVFFRSGTTWTQETYLKASNTDANDAFGTSVAISGDTVVVSASKESSTSSGINGNQTINSGSFVGAAYAFAGVTNNFNYLQTQIAPNGVINGADAYAPDSTAIATAIANPGYMFSAWTGDASGTDNPISLLMDRHKTISAIFSPDTRDPDADGVNTYQESLTYGTNPNLADTDGDGLNDGFELGYGRFSIVPGNFTWMQAKTNAESRSGTLATFATKEEWDRVMLILGTNALLPFDGLWIGATDSASEGTWKWLTGEPFTYSNWATTRPDSAIGNTLDFAEVSGGQGWELGKWYDRSQSSVRQGFILEMGFNTNPVNPDTDSDGWNDGSEIEFGGHPIAPASSPVFTASLTKPSPGTHVVLRFPAMTGRTHRIEASVNLIDWTPWESGIPGTGNVIQRTIPITSQPMRFFKVQRD